MNPKPFSSFNLLYTFNYVYVENPLSHKYVLQKSHITLFLTKHDIHYHKQRNIDILKTEIQV